jgi:hypothetical protein
MSKNRASGAIFHGAEKSCFGLNNLGTIMRTEQLYSATLSLCDLNTDGLGKNLVCDGLRLSAAYMPRFDGEKL